MRVAYNKHEVLAQARGAVLRFGPCARVSAQKHDIR
jgi:hypothetical protein